MTKVSKNNLVCFSMEKAQELLRRGLHQVDVRRNIKYPNLFVYYFERTPEAEIIFKEVMYPSDKKEGEM